MCGFVYFYNIGRTYICSYRCMNVSECAMPWNIGSLGMMWLGKAQAKAGGQPSLAAVPRLLREAAVWDWLEGAQRPGVPREREMHMYWLVTESGIHRRKWLKAREGMRWGNPEDFMGSGGWLSRPAKHPQSLTALLHGKNPNSTFTAPSLLTQLHTALLWGWTHTEIEHTLKNQLRKSPSA